MPPRADTASDADVMSQELAPAVPPVVARVASRSIPASAEVSSPIAPILGVSVVAHVLVALALGALGPIPVLALAEESFVEIQVPPLAPAAEPAVIPPPAPEPEPEPVLTPPAPRIRAVEPPRPEVQPAAAPPPEPTAAPPSLDDVFGEEPAPPAEVMAAQGGSGPAMDLGAAGGMPGGRTGGTGEGVGRGAGGSGVGGVSGPSDADRRRARRAYVRSLEGMLGGRARYPRALERAGVGGRVELCIRIGNDGRVLGSRVCGSAGHDQLDDAALAAANGLDRVPAPPELAAWSPSDEIHAGVVFAVR
jgi:TonB family protein